MIEDLFFKRHQLDFTSPAGVPLELRQVLVRATHIFYHDVAEPLSLSDDFFKLVNDQFERECGFRHYAISQYGRIKLWCKMFLEESLEISESRNSGVTNFFSLKLSLIELLFRRAEENLAQERRPTTPRDPARKSRVVVINPGVEAPPLRDFAVKWYVKGEPIRRAEALRAAIEELNGRFREVDFPFRYHNGLIQSSTDELTEKVIVAPFWSIVADPKWANVDHDMKEARDRAATGGEDPAFYAAMALKSTLKIVSDDNGWTRGSEGGAHGYIDNLVSKGNGRFIEPWEAEALKAFFTR